MTQAAPRQRRKSERPTELLSAALNVFVDKGFAAARMDDIAAIAGVSKGTIFLYFESKQALFRSVIEDAVLPHVLAGEASAHAYQDDPEQLLWELLHTYWRVLGNPKLAGLHKLVLAEAGKFPEIAAYYYENVIARAREMFVHAIRDGIQKGVFHASCDPGLMCRLAVAPMMAECMWQPLAQQFDPDWTPADVLIQMHLDLFMRGLCVNPRQDRSKS